MKTCFTLLLFLLLLPVLNVSAQAPLPLAVEYEGGLYVVNGEPADVAGLQQALLLISGRPSDNYQAAWSPDGTKLAYIIGEKDEPKTLMVWDGGSQLIKLGDNLRLTLRINWTHDGKILLAINPGLVRGDTSPLLVYAIAPEAGAKPELLTDDLPLIGGCGGDLFLPMEWLFWDETDYGGVTPFIALTDYGVVYTPGCGRYHTSLFRVETGERIEFLGGTMIRPALSPDQTRVAGVMSDAGDAMTIIRKLGVVDITTLEETIISTREQPTLVTWGEDGSLYYAAVHGDHELLEGLAPEVLDRLHYIGGSLQDVNYNIVRLYRIAPDGTETLLHEQDAYAVGRLAMNDNTLVYSTIANGDTWLAAMVNGTLNPDDALEQAEDYISTSVHYLRLDESGSVVGGGTLPGNLQRVAVAG